MKKLKFIFTALFIAAAIISCNEVDWNFDATGLKPDLYTKVPKVFPGGNVDCSQLGFPSLDQTTGRNNYVPLTDGFENAWPTGLVVKVENDKSVSFAIDGSLIINGQCYKVGAVIVKGSDASNVYNYLDNGGTGATMDKGLVPPTNASGGPAGLSNLTFCFVECKNEPIVIAVKTYYWMGDIGDYSKLTNAYSSGLSAFTTGWCSPLEYNYYPAIKSFPMQDGVTLANMGTVTVTEGVHSLEVTVDLVEGLTLHKTFLYAGSLEGLLGAVKDGCPDCDGINTPWLFNGTDSNTVTFSIPY